MKISSEQIEQIRNHYPVLGQMVNGHNIVYLDNAATAQVPDTVLSAVQECESARGNVHRGIHTLSEKSTASYENARKTVADYIGAQPCQICFTSGTTDAINRVARSLEPVLTPEDIVLTTRMEHHSNFLPWQQVCRRTGAQFQIVPLLENGDLDLQTLGNMLSERVKLLAVGQCSNVLGTVNDVQTICHMAHERGIKVLVDGAQSICHRRIDVAQMDCDFFAFSGHKLGGPFGIGALYAKETMKPVLFGGGMVDQVRDEDADFPAPPLSLEAGTPNVSGAVGMAAAIEFRKNLPEGWMQYETQLLAMLEKKLSAIDGVKILGSPSVREGCISITAEGVQPFDAAVLADQKGIALRSGHHCAQPLLRSLGLEYALRISPAFYNTEEEIDYLAESLKEIFRILR